MEHGLVKKSGAWYTYEGDQLGQGMENSRRFLIEHPEIAAEIEDKILVKLGIKEDPNAPAAKDGSAPAVEPVRDARLGA